MVLWPFAFVFSNCRTPTPVANFDTGVKFDLLKAVQLAFVMENDSQSCLIMWNMISMVYAVRNFKFPAVSAEIESTSFPDGWDFGYVIIGLSNSVILCNTDGTQFS